MKEEERLKRSAESLIKQCAILLFCMLYRVEKEINSLIPSQSLNSFRLAFLNPHKSSYILHCILPLFKLLPKAPEPFLHGL